MKSKTPCITVNKTDIQFFILVFTVVEFYNKVTCRKSIHGIISIPAVNTDFLFAHRGKIFIRNKAAIIPCPLAGAEYGISYFLLIAINQYHRKFIKIIF